MLNCTIEQVNVTLASASTDLVRATTYKILEFDLESLLLFFIIVVAIYAIFNKLATGLTFIVQFVCMIISIPYYIWIKHKAKRGGVNQSGVDTRQDGKN